MNDFVTGLMDKAEQAFGLMKVLVIVFTIIAGVLTLGVVTYALRTTAGPIVTLCQWMCWYTPGEEPHPVVLGVSHGLRLVAWASLLGLAGYFLISSFGG